MKSSEQNNGSSRRVPAQQGQRSSSPPTRRSSFGGSPFNSSSFSSSPFQVMRQMQEDMDQIWQQMFGGGSLPTSFGGSSQSSQQLWSPTVDVSEDEKEWRVEADLPGVKEEDIELSVQDGCLSVCAEVKQESDADSQQGNSARRADESSRSGQPRRYYRRERQYGYMERTLPLPQGIDEDGIRAEFRDGVLTVHVPKSEEAQRTRRVPIGASDSSSQSRSRNAGQSSGQASGQASTQSSGQAANTH